MHALEMFVALAVLTGPLPAAAQSALILRADGVASPTVEAAIDIALRESSVGSVRRIEPSLGELALASGCAQPEPDEVCLGAIALATSADELWLQHLSHDGAGWRIHLEVHGRDGARLWSMDARCGEAPSCGAPLRRRLEERSTATGASTADALGSRRSSSPSARVRRSLSPVPATPVGATPGPPRRDMLPSILFAGGSVLGSGAILSGVLAMTLSDPAGSREGRRGDGDAALSSSLDFALVVGTTLGACAVGLTVAAAICLVWPSRTDGLSLTRDGLTIAF